MQEELLDLRGRLSRTQWSALTVLPGWDVHSIALHLLGGDIGRLSAAWRGRPGSASEATFPDPAAAIERSNEEWLTSARLIPPPLLVELLRLTAGRVSQLFEEVDLWAPGTPVTWTGSGPSPVWLDVAREYTERWVHQADPRGRRPTTIGRSTLVVVGTSPSQRVGRCRLALAVWPTPARRGGGRGSG